MSHNFQADCLATLIGSLPLSDHDRAGDLILEYIPEIPIWAQLPIHKNEGMLHQFSSGLPGFCVENGKGRVDTERDGFDNELLDFYEAYLAVTEGRSELEASRFTLTEETARGFFVMMERLQSRVEPPVALKGQIVGPFTLATGITDQNKRPIFYDPRLKDAVVKLLALKARWQARRLAALDRPVMIFFDEPALAGVGSSEFTSISNNDIRQCLEEVFDAVHLEGGLAGVHICANTDWPLVLDSSVDIVSFDAYAYFDRFILYPDLIKKFLDSGKMLAWGIVPTLDPVKLQQETAASILNQWDEKVERLAALSIETKKLAAQSLITPSCGTGSLNADLAIKVLELTRTVSLELRNRYGM